CYHVLHTLSHRDATEREDGRRVADWTPVIAVCKALDPDWIGYDGRPLDGKAIVANEVIAEHLADADEQRRVADPTALHERAEERHADRQGIYVNRLTAQ